MSVRVLEATRGMFATGRRALCCCQVEVLRQEVRLKGTSCTVQLSHLHRASCQHFTQFRGGRRGEGWHKRALRMAAPQLWSTRQQAIAMARVKDHSVDALRNASDDPHRSYTAAFPRTPLVAYHEEARVGTGVRTAALYTPRVPVSSRSRRRASPHTVHPA